MLSWSLDISNGILLSLWLWDAKNKNIWEYLEENALNFATNLNIWWR